MRRYARVAWRAWSATIQAELEYRVNFVLALLTTLGTMAGALFSLALFYRNGFALGGWSWSEVELVIGFYTVLDGLHASLFAPSHIKLSEQVRDGTLDFALLKPVDSQFLVSVQHLSVWGIPGALLGLGIVAHAGITHEPPLAAADYAAGVVPLLSAVAILYAIGFMLATTSIWFVKLWNLTIALQSLLEAGRLPISAYPPAYRAVFTFVVPVAFLTTVPARAMAQGDARDWVLASAALAVVLGVAARVFWRRALRSYTSASS